MHPSAATQTAPSAAWLLAAPLVLCLALAGGACAQTPAVPPVRVYTGQPSTPGAEIQQGEASESQWMEYEKRLRTLNADRQKSLEADTVKLLRLAQELSAELASQAGGPTPAQLRKVAEVEKLARRVKEKMSTSVRGLALDTGPYTPGP